MKYEENKYAALEEELWPELQNKKRNWKKILKPVGLIGLGLLCFLGGCIYVKASLPGQSEASLKFDAVLDMMENKWYYADQVDDLEQTLVDNALLGLTYSDIDLHTNYIPNSYAQQYQSSVDATSVGIGVSYYTGSEFVVTRVYKNSPAEIGGLQKGDVIIAVDGQSVDANDKSLVLSDLVMGEEGSEVVITVKRGEEVLDFTCIRGLFSASAYGEIIDQNVGYLAISDFGITTAQDARLYLDDMIKAGVTKLMIDLRGDSGGYITTLQAMASLFIPENKLVIYTQDKDGNRNDIYTIGDNYTQFNEFVILVDGQSASASEGFTITMKENLDNVTIIGTTTYGKGSMQDSYSLLDGSILKLTTGKWFSPNGINVDGIGIEPDIAVDSHPVLTMTIYEYDETSGHTMDTVSQQNGVIQAMLDYLDYPVNRMDGYFDQSTQDACLTQYCKDNDISYSDSYDQTIYDALFDDVMYESKFDPLKDTVYQKGMELLHE